MGNVVAGEALRLAGNNQLVNTYQQVDLSSVWPVDTHPQGGYKDHVWHSAEFRSDNMSRAAFWNRVLTRMQLK